MRNPPVSGAGPAPVRRARSRGEIAVRLLFTLRIRHPAQNAANTPLGGGVSPLTRGGLLSDGSFDNFWVVSGPWFGLVRGYCGARDRRGGGYRRALDGARCTPPGSRRS